MRIAFISDVHADLHALIDAIEQSTKLGCDQIVCAGDIVDGGLFPQETIDLLIENKIPRFVAIMIDGRLVAVVQMRQMK